MPETKILEIGRRSLMVGGALTTLALSTGVLAQGRSAVRPSRALRVGPYSTPPEAIIRTSNGPIRGYRNGEIYTFKGVPYGADTSGKNRFKPPQRPLAWSDTLPAITYGKACPQRVGDDSNPIMRAVAWADYRLQGEDCLNLNVFTPSVNAGDKLPVVVWLHGGGFQVGSSREQPDYDGTNLAARGAVFVSVNHRLGVLGFLDLSAAGSEFSRSANAGMLDIVLALEWVRDNIGRFGGDPACVTIAGQSGGGAKVSTLMAMPRARGLFHRAVVMSGSPRAFAGRDKTREITQQVATAAGIGATDFAAWQALDVDRLLAAGAGRPGSGPMGGIFWQPSLHPSDLPVDWSKGAPPSAAGIPLIVGSVRDEFRRFAPPPLDNGGMLAQLSPRFSARTAELIDSLRGALPGAAPIDIVSAVGGLSWRQNALDQAAKQSQVGKSYQYWLTYSSAVLDRGIGVPHGADVGYFFDNCEKNPALSGQTREAYVLAERMSRSLLNFARTGNPVTADVAWTAYDPARLNTMVFDATPRLVNDPAGLARKIVAAMPSTSPFG